MTPVAAAAYLELDVKTITRWARQGYLPAHPLGEGKRKFWRFLEHELAAWLATRTNHQDLA
jgi:excisionase family DNA binding protein